MSTICLFSTYILQCAVKEFPNQCRQGVGMWSVNLINVVKERPPKLPCTTYVHTCHHSFFSFFGTRRAILHSCNIPTPYYVQLVHICDVRSEPPSLPYQIQHNSPHQNPFSSFDSKSGERDTTHLKAAAAKRCAAPSGP